MADSQLANGLVPNIAPEYVEFPGTFRAAAEWGSSVILVPWQQYLFCGDRRLLEEYYPTMQQYLGYLSSIATDHIVSEGLGDWYDIGPGGRPGAAKLTLPPVTATAYYYYDAKILAEIATLLGHPDDAKGYSALADEIRRAWIREFRNADGIYGSNSQCINALALVMGLTEEADREKVLGELVKDIRGRGNAVTAGDVGFRSVLQALAGCDASDVGLRHGDPGREARLRVPTPPGRDRLNRGVGRQPLRLPQPLHARAGDGVVLQGPGRHRTAIRLSPASRISSSSRTRCWESTGRRASYEVAPRPHHRPVGAQGQTPFP